MVPLIGEGSPVQECEHAQRGQAQHQVTQDPAPNDNYSRVPALVPCTGRINMVHCSQYLWVYI
jgi:hypothetical protein